MADGWLRKDIDQEDLKGEMACAIWWMLMDENRETERAEKRADREERRQEREEEREAHREMKEELREQETIARMPKDKDMKKAEEDEQTLVDVAVADQNMIGRQ